MFKTIILVSLVCSVAIAIPELELKNKIIGQVSSFVATTNIGSDNQLCLPVDIKASSVCAISGIWILYPESNFMSTDPANTKIMSVARGGNPICENLPAALDKSLGSYRPAGNTLTDECTLNVYIGKGYTETETYYGANGTSTVLFAFNSVISSDPSCQWQFYMKENFDGFSECIRPNAGGTNANQFVSDFTSVFGVSAGDIKSIRAGCTKPPVRSNEKFPNFS